MNHFTRKSFKQLACCGCGEIVLKVDADAVLVKCWKCTNEELSGVSQEAAEVEFEKSLKKVDLDCSSSK